MFYSKIKDGIKQIWHYRYLHTKVSKGFTLAEILITLLIVGIIGSIVIPALIQDTQNTELKVAWKRNYSDLSQATVRLVHENGGSLKGLFSDREAVKKSYLPYLNYVKNCPDTKALGNCWIATAPDNLDGTPGDLFWWQATTGIVLNNGSFVLFTEGDVSKMIDCSYQGFECARIVVDVNGFKGPNIVGKDIFYARITETALKPMGFGTNIQCPSGKGGDCSTKYLYE